MLFEKLLGGNLQGLQLQTFFRKPRLVDQDSSNLSPSLSKLSELANLDVPRRQD